ncbi:MAG: SprT-like domain-containing protein [Muribaculaceae bacterium]|nr:SprT-like domain-containing protein [Muribaculaceae bacterium]
MRPTLDYVRLKFDEFNRLCFAGELPILPIRMSNAGRALGMFVHPRVSSRRMARDPKTCHIRISTRLDLPEQEVEDTIIHEMIHYWIWYKAIPDNATHGDAFMAKLREINRLHGRRITVRHHSSEEQLATDRHHRNNYICVQRWNDGRLTLTVCARTCIFDIHRAFSGHPQVTSVEWYWSMNSWFNRFPLSRTAKAYILTPADFTARFADATPCVCDGTTLRPRPRR